MNYVTYEQAVKLKELGFNEECHKCYFPNPFNDDFDLVDTNKNLPNQIFTILELYKRNYFNKVVLAPLVSQAINWFRKEGIHGYIHHSVSSNYARQCTFSVYIDGYETYHHRYIISNYEYCEEALLDYLIKRFKTL